MKKVLIAIAFIFGAIQFSNAQINYGLKAGLNFASPSDAVVVDENGDTQPNTGIDANTSWHAGGWLRVKVPILGLYVRPEVIYTSITSTLPIEIDGLENDYKNQLSRLDIPVLVGFKFLGVGNIFAGPVFEYVLTSDFDSDELQSVETEDFFVGAQIGVGVELKSIGIDLRYETAFSDATSEFSDPNIGVVVLDNAPNQFILGLSYKF